MTQTPVTGTTQSPYNAVVRIGITINGLSTWGSGVLISPDEVLTADHVSYDSGLDNGSFNGVAGPLEIVPGDNGGTAPYGTYAGTVAHYFKMPTTGSIGLSNIQSDYSVIHLSKPVVGVTPMTVTPDYAGGSVHVTGYPQSAGGYTMIDDTQTVRTDPNFTILEGSGLTPGSSGSPVWRIGSDGSADVVGVVSSSSPDTSYDVQITSKVAAQLAAWVKQDDADLNKPQPPQPPQPPAPTVAIYDTTTNAAVADTFSHPYSGPVAGITTEFVDLTTDSLNISASSPNYFIHTGAGNDAVALSSGTNVVDGSYGSNFLSSGSGADTFFVDARGAVQDTWSTVTSFHSGDAATLWGISPSTATLNWSDGGGAAGYTGLTLHATAAGKPTASITLAGLSQANLTSGKLSASFGHDTASNSDYLYVHAT